MHYIIIIICFLLRYKILKYIDILYLAKVCSLSGTLSRLSTSLQITSSATVSMLCVITMAFLPETLIRTSTIITCTWNWHQILTMIISFWYFSKIYLFYPDFVPVCLLKRKTTIRNSSNLLLIWMRYDKKIR